jgi:hypothetical protein
LELSALYALPSRGWLQNALNREYAIRRDALPELEKWAKREAAALMLPQPERGEPTKTRVPER